MYGEHTHTQAHHKIQRAMKATWIEHRGILVHVCVGQVAVVEQRLFAGGFAQADIWITSLTIATQGKNEPP